MDWQERVDSLGEFYSFLAVRADQVSRYFISLERSLSVGATGLRQITIRTKAQSSTDGLHCMFSGLSPACKHITILNLLQGIRIMGLASFGWCRSYHKLDIIGFVVVLVPCSVGLSINCFKTSLVTRIMVFKVVAKSLLTTHRL